MVEIKELLLRIPHLSREEGRYLGEQVSRRISENLSAGRDSRYIGRMDLKLTLPGNASRRELADMIADAIRGKIDNGSPSGSQLVERKDNSGPASRRKHRQENAS